MIDVRQIKSINPDDILADYEYMPFYESYTFVHNCYRVAVSVKLIPARMPNDHPSLILTVYVYDILNADLN
jgi:hypothetical protein